MKIKTTWEPAPIGDGGEYLKHNGITVARIWPKGEAWQIAVGLPEARVFKHILSTRQSAKNTCEHAVKEWFDRISGE